MNSLKQQISERGCQSEQKACLASQFVSSLNIITDSNRFYQPRGTSKPPEGKEDFMKPPSLKRKYAEYSSGLPTSVVL